jgi:hypothetical protein
MDFEVNSSHYVSSRLSLWCPVCGAKENQPCKTHQGNRFDSHNAYALGTVPRPVIQLVDASVPTARKDAGNRPKWTPQKWVN